MRALDCDSIAALMMMKTSMHSGSRGHTCRQLFSAPTCTTTCRVVASCAGMAPGTHSRLRSLCTSQGMKLDKMVHAGQPEATRIAVDLPQDFCGAASLGLRYPDSIQAADNGAGAHPLGHACTATYFP